MTPRARKILRILSAAGLVAVRLSDDLHLVLVPLKTTTVTIVNPEGFSPHRKEEQITAARVLLLSFGSTGASVAKSHAAWDSVGAMVVVAKTMESVVAALDSVGFDLEKALEVADG